MIYEIREDSDWERYAEGGDEVERLLLNEMDTPIEEVRTR